MKKVVINACYGGFGLSKEAYEKLIEWGVPLRDYAQEKQGPDGLPEPSNDGEVILRSTGEWRVGREPYWDTWTRESREHPLIVRVVEELGAAANGPCAQLKVVVIPDGVDYEIAEYDGNEHIAEKHRTWG
jgi:hypothetical protein